jgi:hypothetical protein
MIFCELALAIYNPPPPPTHTGEEQVAQEEVYNEEYELI